MDIQESKPEEKGSSLKKWFKRIGIAGFLFFLIKGLAWIALFLWTGKCVIDNG